MLQSVNTEVTVRLAGDLLQGVRWSLAARGHVCEYVTGITNEQLCHAFPIFLMGLGSLQSYEKHYPPINSTGESPTQVDRGNLRQTPTYVSTQTQIYWCPYLRTNLRRMQMQQQSMYIWQSCICSFYFKDSSCYFQFLLTLLRREMTRNDALQKICFLICIFVSFSIKNI